jgi:signal transduction histidine kinase
MAHLTYAEADRLTEEGILQHWECDYRIRTRAGETRWVADSCVQVRDEHGARIGVIGILQDITERKLAEAERETFIKELEIRNAELERFNYTVSHELKSPVVTIKGFLGSITKDLQNGNYARVQQDILRVSNATEKMHDTLSDLLQLSRIGRIVSPPEEIDLVQLVREVLETLQGQLEARHITIHIEPDLPTAFGDRARLREVYENLIGNAAKHFGDQSIPLIEIGVRKNRYETVYFVKDNGIGIDAQYHKRIFGLFDKLDAASEGTGIGLAIVKRIIETHGGRVWVESEGLGKGSLFCFTIPDGRP